MDLEEMQMCCFKVRTLPVLNCWCIMSVYFERYVSVFQTKAFLIEVHFFLLEESMRCFAVHTVL